MKKEKLKQQYPKFEFEIDCVINEIQHENRTTKEDQKKVCYQ